MKNKKTKLALITLLTPTIISTQSILAEEATDIEETFTTKTEEPQKEVNYSQVKKHRWKHQMKILKIM